MKINEKSIKDWLSGKDLSYIIKLKNKSNKFKFEFLMRSSKNFMGRFGGGWQWKLGIQASDSTIIVSLLIAELRISWFGLTKDGKKYYN